MQPFTLISIGFRTFAEFLGDVVGDSDIDIVLGHVLLEGPVLVIGGTTHGEYYAGVAVALLSIGRSTPAITWRVPGMVRAKLHLR